MWLVSLIALHILVYLYLLGCLHTIFISNKNTIIFSINLPKEVFIISYRLTCIQIPLTYSIRTRTRTSQNVQSLNYGHIRSVCWVVQEMISKQY